MTDFLSRAAKMLRRLEKSGFEAVLVGGMVRDLLANFPPGDVDIASNAPLAVITSLFPSGKLLGPEGMKVFLLPFDEGHCEICSYSGRSLRDDLARRDFTVNALALRLSGELVGSRRSLRDMADRVLRFNGRGADRLDEDPLRALRLARFAATLPGFSVASGSFVECSAESESSSLQKCAPERIGREIRLGLEGNPRIFLEALREGGMMKPLFQALPLREFDFSRVCLVVDGLAALGAPLEVRTAALFSHRKGISLSDEDRAKCAQNAIIGWKWPTDMAELISELVRLRCFPLEPPNPERMAGLLSRRGTSFFESLFLLSRQFCATESHFRRWSENRALFVSMAMRSARDDDILPKGAEVMKRFSLLPGPLVGELLEAAKRRHVFPGFSSREEAYIFMESTLKKKHLP